MLSGANHFAVETPAGWEVFAARDAVLTAPETYTLSYLLRGLAGSDADMVDSLAAGARLLWLGQGLSDIAVDAALIGADITARVVMAGRESDPLTQPYKAAHLRPLSPVHGKITQSAEGARLSWIRRTREGGDSWSGLDVPLGEDVERYRIRVILTDGVEQTLEAAAPHCILPAPPSGIARIEVAQASQAYGYGPPLLITP